VLQVDCAIGSEVLPPVEQNDPPLVLRLESHRNGMCEYVYRLEPRLSSQTNGSLHDRLSLVQGQQGKLKRDRDTCALAGAIDRAIQMGEPCVWAGMAGPLTYNFLVSSPRHWRGSSAANRRQNITTDHAD
jgi:hypothetical protein